MNRPSLPRPSVGPAVTKTVDGTKLAGRIIVRLAMYGAWHAAFAVWAILVYRGITQRPPTQSSIGPTDPSAWQNGLTVSGGDVLPATPAGLWTYAGAPTKGAIAALFIALVVWLTGRYWPKRDPQQTQVTTAQLNFLYYGCRWVLPIMLVAASVGLMTGTSADSFQWTLWLIAAGLVVFGTGIAMTALMRCGVNIRAFCKADYNEVGEDNRSAKVERAREKHNIEHRLTAPRPAAPSPSGQAGTAPRPATPPTTGQAPRPAASPTTGQAGQAPRPAAPPPSGQAPRPAAGVRPGHPVIDMPRAMADLDSMLG